mmetsp:Transcript_24484/g.58714  ORF Transcript_24484/g.58714 Transcript_24484/m.58714 type:complete len:379 (-) Transcript_24484:3506-4642(-)
MDSMSSSFDFCSLARAASSSCSFTSALPTLLRIMAASFCLSSDSCWCTVFICAFSPSTLVPTPRSDAANSPESLPTCALAVRTVASMAAALPTSFSLPAWRRSALPRSDFVARASRESRVFLSFSILFCAFALMTPVALSAIVSVDALRALTLLSSTLVTCATASLWSAVASLFCDSSALSSSVSLAPIPWSCCCALNLRCCTESSILDTLLLSAAFDAASAPSIRVRLPLSTATAASARPATRLAAASALPTFSSSESFDCFACLDRAAARSDSSFPSPSAILDLASAMFASWSDTMSAFSCFRLALAVSSPSLMALIRLSDDAASASRAPSRASWCCLSVASSAALSEACADASSSLSLAILASRRPAASLSDAVC